MPMVTMDVPISVDKYYAGESVARAEGVSLYQKIEEWVTEYIEDAEDTKALADAIAEDDGTRYTDAELREELGL